MSTIEIMHLKKDDSYQAVYILSAMSYLYKNYA